MKTIELNVEQIINDAGQLIREEFWLNGGFHNEHGPAVRVWNDAGQLIYEAFWLNDRLHNEHGPAIREWNDAGQLTYEEFWLNYERLSKDKWIAKTQSCVGKIVTIDGKQYRLEEVK